MDVHGHFLLLFRLYLQKLYREDPPQPFRPEQEDLDTFSELIGDRCSCERLMMSRQDILRSKGIDLWVDFWGWDCAHDWPWWYKQVAYFVPYLLEQA